MKLYTYFRSSAAYRTRIALNLKGLDYEALPVNLRAPVSAQRSSEYLEEAHPSPPLLPRTALARAQVRALTFAIACDIHPLNNLRVLNYLRAPLGHADAEVNAWYGHWIARGFQALEAQVAHSSGDGRHMFQDTVTLADVCIVPQMYNARRQQCDVAPYPRLRAICEHLESLPAFASAAPEAQPDAA